MTMYLYIDTKIGIIDQYTDRKNEFLYQYIEQ
jgi:hypothetical protein